MGFFDLFRKRTTREEFKQDALLASAYLKQAYQQRAGEPLSVGVELVVAELSSGRPVEYGLIKTPEAFRLGVISYFAVLAAMLPKRQGMYSVLYTTGSASHKLYLQDRYGTNKISAEEYMTAFGISIKSGVSLSQYHMHKALKEKIIEIVPESDFNMIRGFGRDMFPIVKDDGKMAVMIV